MATFLGMFIGYATLAIVVVALLSVSGLIDYAWFAFFGLMFAWGVWEALTD